MCLLNPTWSSSSAVTQSMLTFLPRFPTVAVALGSSKLLWSDLPGVPGFPRQPVRFQATEGGYVPSPSCDFPLLSCARDFVDSCFCAFANVSVQERKCYHTPYESQLHLTVAVAGTTRTALSVCALSLGHMLRDSHVRLTGNDALTQDLWRTPARKGRGKGEALEVSTL